MQKANSYLFGNSIKTCSVYVHINIRVFLNFNIYLLIPIAITGEYIHNIHFICSAINLNFDLGFYFHSLKYC